MSSAGLVVESAGLAAAVVILAIWAGAQQRTAAELIAQAPSAQVQAAKPAARGASIEALVTRAEDALMRGDEEHAMLSYQAVLALEPHHQEAGLREVELLLSAGRDEDAVRALMPRMLWMVPGSEDHARALCLEAGGRMAVEPERAIALAAQACEAGAEACCNPFTME
jgi:hypothetical protein